MESVRAGATIAHVCFLAALVASMAVRSDHAIDTAPPYYVTSNPPRAELRGEVAISRELVAITVACIALASTAFPVVYAKDADGAPIIVVGTSAGPLASVAWPLEHIRRWCQGLALLMSARSRTPAPLVACGFLALQMSGIMLGVIADHAEARDYADDYADAYAVDGADDGADATPRGGRPRRRRRPTPTALLLAEVALATVTVAWLSLALYMRTADVMVGADFDTTGAFLLVGGAAYVLQLCAQTRLLTAPAAARSRRMYHAALVLDCALNASITLLAVAHPNS